MTKRYCFCTLLVLLCSINFMYAQCAAGETEIQVNIVPDNWGSEITWQLTAPGGTPIYGSGGPYTDNVTTPINVNVCVQTGSQVVFTIFDGYGDGICCSEGNGSYTVTTGGVTVASGGSYGTSESTTFYAPVLAYDISVDGITSPFPFVGSNETVSISGKLKNTSATTVTDLNMSYQIGSNPVVTENFSTLSISPAGNYNFTFATQWSPTSIGSQALRVWINDINSGNADMNAVNDTTSMLVEVYQGITPVNRIADFLAAAPTYTTIATSSDQINKPTDLDFHPVADRKELWVLNEDTEATGGATVTIADAGLPTQTEQWLRDGNAWHFMSLPTGLAFGTNGNWANSPGIYDANHDGGAPFTGPSLWSSDMSIYAQYAGPNTNGSHLDMLHETPYGMGIAHHKDNAYWLFDGNSSDIVYYDFVEDHGPGQSYHGDAIIRRYPVTVLKDGDVPSHLILDKSTGWLYIIDTGNDRVLRMNTATGTFQNSLNGYEAVEEYSQMSGVTSETVIDTGLVRPCGIDIIEDRMIVGDYTTGDIRFYDISVNPASYLGTISTGAAGLTGLKIGPGGDIWFTNRLTNEVRRMTPSIATGLVNTVSQEDLGLYPNPATKQFNVVFPSILEVETEVQIVDALGRIVVHTSLNQQKEIAFDCSDWVKGVYMINVQNERTNISKTIRIQ